MCRLGNSSNHSIVNSMKETIVSVETVFVVLIYAFSLGSTMTAMTHGIRPATMTPPPLTLMTFTMNMFSCARNRWTNQAAKRASTMNWKIGNFERGPRRANV